MSGTIGISCTTQNNKQNKNLYFKAIDVLETTYSSVKLSYLTNLDKSVNNVNVKTLKEVQPKFTYTAGPFYVTCKSDTNFEYRGNTLIINEECTEIEISNKDITTPAECSISINNPSVKIILNGVNIKNTLKRDAIYASQYRRTIDINLHIKENTTNTIESINTGINLEDTSGGVITGNFLISGDNNDNAKLEIKGNNNYNAILSTAANIKISGGNISIKKVDTTKDLIITGGKSLFKTNTSGFGSYSWSVGGNITIDNAIAVFEAVEPFGKYSLNNTRSSSNITIGKSAVVSGANDFYYACKKCNAGFSTCNTGIEMNKYTILEDGTIFVKEDVEYWQPDGAGEGFIGKDTKMRFKKINLSTGFVLTNNGTIEIQGADVITGTSGTLINNGTIDNYGEIGEVSTYGFGLENNGVINNYNEAKLYVLENITGSGNINQIATTPETTLTLSGQEGIDWVQEADRYLIKNTCKEITLSGSTNKNIESEDTDQLLTINLNNIDATNSELTINRNATVFIKQNSTNNLKSITLNGDFENKRTIILSGNNDVDCTLNVSSIIVNTFSNIEINNGIINASSIIGAEGLGNIGKVVLNGGIVNTDQFGGSNDGRTENGITINNGILYTNILGCSGGDGDTSDVKFLGGVVRFNYWESYRLSEISNSAVIITPTQSIFDTLKSKNKGLIIQSQQFTSIDSLKIFDINNETGEITIKEPLTLKNSNNSNEIEDKMIINNGCKVISNNLYFEDGTGNISRAPEKPTYEAAILNNNGILIVNIGTRLYVNCLVPIYLHHENNGIIYNLGEIDGKKFLKGTGRIVELDITAEVNGELYNDITVDKTNRTVTINNLTPETDYDINLIASFEPYIKRSKTIKQRTIKAPSLINGSEFNSKIKQLENINNVKEIKFIKENSLKDGVELSTSNNYIKGYITDTTLNISSIGPIKSNADSSHMFDGLANIEKIALDNFIETDITNAESMFNGCTKLRSISNLENWNTRKITNMNTMFAECPVLVSKMTLMRNSSIVDMFKNSCKIEDETTWDSNYGYFIVDYKKSGNFFDDYNLQTVFNNLINKYENTTTKVLRKETNTLLPGKVFRKVIRFNADMGFGIYFEKVNNIEQRIKELKGREINDISLDGSIISVEDEHWRRHVISESEIFANKDCENMFIAQTRCKDGGIDIYLDNFNTKKVTNMKGMFKNNEILSLHNYNFKTDRPINAEEMFAGCYGTYMTEVGGLTSIDLSKFGQIENATRMFAGCEYLETIGDASRLDYADKLDEVFKNCKKLKGSMTSPNATSYTGMFEGACTAEGSGFVLNYYESSETPDVVKPMLKTGSFDSKIGFNGEIIKGGDFLSKVATLEGTKTLRHIISQDSIPSSFPGKNVDVSAAQDGSVMAWLGSDNETVYIGSNSQMYANSNCASMFSSNFIETIDISKIRFKYLETVYWMFGGAEGSPLAPAIMPESNLRTITGIENISFKNVTSLDYMFYMCGNLTTSIVIDNPNITSYTSMLEEANDSPQNRGVITIKYIDDATKVIAERIVNDPNTRPNVVLYTPKKCLISGPEFNAILQDVMSKMSKGPFNEEYPSIVFDQLPDTYTEDYVNKTFDFIVDVSEDKDKSIMLYASEYGDNLVEIRSNNKIVFNKDCSNMFKDVRLNCNWFNGKGTFSLNFNYIDSSKVTNMESMFEGFILDPYKENGSSRFLNLTNLNTSNATNFNRTFANMQIESITNFVIRKVPNTFEAIFEGTGPRSEYDKIILGWVDSGTKEIAEMIWRSMSSWNQAYFEVPETASI